MNYNYSNRCFTDVNTDQKKITGEGICTTLYFFLKSHIKFHKSLFCCSNLTVKFEGKWK